MKEHNDCWNKSGKAHSSNKRDAPATAVEENPTATKKARVLSPDSENPTNMEGLQSEEGPLCKIDSLDASCHILFTSQGNIWLHAQQTCEMDTSFPLALAYGKFKVGQDFFFGF